ncbi:MAG: hypothetical protein AAFR61_03280 [Bacteroidota bacterium]
MKSSLFGVLLASFFLFAACEKSAFLDKKEGKEKGECPELIYPLSYTLPDGSVITGQDEKEVNSLMKDWYVAHPDATGKPTMNFPVQISWEEGVTKSLANEDELAAAFKECKEDWEKKEECFEMVYPITYTMPDSTIITGNDEASMNQALKAWYTANPDAKEKPIMSFPLDITFKDGTTKTLHNLTEWKAAWKECKGK